MDEKFDGFEALIRDLKNLEEQIGGKAGFRIYQMRTLAEGGFYHLNYAKLPERKEIRVPYIERRK